jgi:hypothetical protein
MRQIGTEAAQTRLRLRGIVATGWWVEQLPSRVGSSARVPRRVYGR